MPVTSSPVGTPSAADLIGAAELANYRPNELGWVLILEYHRFTTDPAKEDQWTRTIADFRDDLRWLYEHDFYVVPLRDVILNRIAAPLGKHPVVLTFDDGYVDQLRFLPQADGTPRIDPKSAVGVLEEMFAAHPDFGRGGHFAVLPFNCFHYPDEPDQKPYCQAKLRWLIEHGYEVGNHTFGHTDLLNVDDETFKATIADAIAWADELVPGNDADILTVPFGHFPDPQLHSMQETWLREGFAYEGREIKLVGALKVGSDPAPSPVSAEWDPYRIPRVQAFDEWLARWWTQLEREEEMLYVSDGNPDTITIPKDLPYALQDTFDPAKAAGKRVIEY